MINFWPWRGKRYAIIKWWVIRHELVTGMIVGFIVGFLFGWLFILF